MHDTAVTKGAKRDCTFSEPRMPLDKTSIYEEISTFCDTSKALKSVT